MGNAGMVGLVFLAMLAGRAVAVYSGVPASRFFRMEAIPKNWSHVMFWGGLRGGIAVALALSLPDIEYKTAILSITYGVVLFSIIVQGLTVKPLVKRMVR